MGKKLAIYTENAFKEYILPSIDNSDYSITLHRDLFGLKRDVELKLEVMGKKWTIVRSRVYQLKKGDQIVDTPLEDGDMLKLCMANGQQASIIVRESPHIVNAFEKYDIRKINQVTIGRGEENSICYSFLKFVSQSHARLLRESGSWFVEDTSNVNGVFVNSRRIQNKRELQFGDYINIMGLHILFLGKILAVDITGNVKINANVLKRCSQDTFSETMALAQTTVRPLFHRSPRSIQKIETDPITIEQPPAPEKPEDLPLFMAIGPSLTMAFPMLISCAMMILSSKSSGAANGIYMYTGLIMAVSSAAVAIFWTLHNQKFHKKKLKEKELLRFDRYSQYLVKKTEEIKEKYEHNMEAMKKRYLPAEECASYSAANEMLWNRNVYHSDFMCHRLGLGDLPFQAPIKVAEERFSLLDDSLSEKPRFILENYKTLFQVPVAVELIRNRLIGVVGGVGKKGAIEVARLLSAQIAANNCYTDIKLAYAYDESSSMDKDQWDFAKWFPHVWSEDRKVRFTAPSRPEIVDMFYEMSKIFRHREETAEKMEGKIYKPHYILFVSNPELLDGEMISKYIFEETLNFGLTTILLVERREELPNSCHFVIENTSEFQGIYDTMQGEDDRLAVKFDTLDDRKLCEFARRLANIEVQEVEEGGEMPNSLSFFDMYHVDKLEDFHVLERWKKNRTYDNIKGLIGEKAGGKACYLDVHEKFHGPHGLVAGTTGSGKSETLQTYMLSLALNYSPDDVGYFVIDYKGGGMANLFTGLPHLIGQISNLSENQVHRAMVSIKSENRHRQQIFNENGVNNINAYTKLYKNGEATQPVPHLFIIIDEFAELKREEPDFMRELISVAQVGRSLGVHLILATQKPSGTVDDNIWSNSKFRLCLRVQDKQDSNDMLHKPDAAYITQAGRCYLQVGNDEVFELFQSGFSGAPYIGNTGNGKTDTVRLLTSTGKVDMTGGYTKGLLKRKMQLKWIHDLENVLLASLKLMHLPLEKLTWDEDTEKGLLDHMYSEFERLNIEYPRSNYNEKRLIDFINIYRQAKKLTGDVSTNILLIAKQAAVKLPQEKEHTQLDAVKDYLAEVARANGYVHNLQLWLPVLPQYIYLSEFPEFTQQCFDGREWKKLTGAWNLSVLMGKADDPHNQAQMPLYIDISEGGHLAVCGAVTSGKSTFVQTFVYGLISRYSPQYVNIYALDFSSKMLSAFEEAPHVGGIMYEGDTEKIAKFFNMLERILAERKQIFHGGNYSQYIKANGVKFPAIFVVIDNVSAFMEKTEEIYLDSLIQLSKEGVSHGIYLILAAAGFGRNEIPNRVAENVLNTVAIQQTDRFAYGDILRDMNFDIIPETGMKGRGLGFCEGRILEFQTLLSLEAEDDYKRLEKITDKCREMKNAWSGKVAREIPQIPEKPLWSEFVKLDDVKKLAAEPDRIPVGYNAVNASVYAVNLRNIYCYLIAGEHRTGKTNYMRVLIEAALLKDSDICIMDTPGRHLRTYADRSDLTYVNSDRQVFDYFQRLIPEFKRRNAIKNEMVNKDYEEEEIFQKVKMEKPYFIFITDLAWFIPMVQDSEYKMQGFLENILDKGRLHNIYFFACMSLEDRSEVAGTSLFNLFTADRRGMHFGGNAAGNSIFNFDYLGYKEQAETQKAGIGMLPGPLYEGDAEKVVVPLVRGKKND